jgi:GntR family transcriptional regulator
MLTREATMSEPMYRMIAQDLLEKIQTGSVSAGEQLPTELELRDKYNVSRNTVRDAIRWLAIRGFVETWPGQGTFAARRIQPFVTTLSTNPRPDPSGVGGASWQTEVRDGGQVPHASVPKVEVRSAPSSIADRLHVPEGTQVLTRRQECFIDQTPWSLQTTAYAMDLVNEGATRLLVAEDIPEGTTAYLCTALGIREAGHRDRVLVRQPHEDESRFFKLPDDGRVSVVVIVSTGYRQDSDRLVPFRVTFTTFPADRNQFVIDYGSVPREPTGPAEK